VSLDVLEHVFSYEAALREMLRVLKSGGVAIITVPFNWGQPKTVRRAQVDGGGVRHLLPPIYHSDPVNKDGALLVFDYGWDLLGVMYAIGWQDVHFTHVWSESRKYFGRNFILRGLKA
jgi:SAM-dependent methyltransferase